MPTPAPQTQYPTRRSLRPKDFSRPELTSGWQKFSGNVAVRVSAAVVLLGGTGALVVAAVSLAS
ncbi:hypothetical protein [Subtercola endophyticus]|uniref:hypothetical protein n=1 Tax=Subtercola endophyticus TaxID=2895559 RepID=UPI001E5CE342|nr:hypothetical protein [Subtercola endophyticus]UFS59636.1 hypothetical protein LQ955_02205 [Subtercola endophyticus]